jgi:hypothetical protein
VRRLVEDGAKAAFSVVKPAGNQILHGILMQVPNPERNSIDIAHPP